MYLKWSFLKSFLCQHVANQHHVHNQNTVKLLVDRPSNSVLEIIKYIVKMDNNSRLENHYFLQLVAKATT